MPSITDVYNELKGVNGRLDTANANLQFVLTRLQTIDSDLNSGINNVVATLNAGFAVLSVDAQAILKLQAFTNELLLHQVKQQQTMICILEKISRNTCDLVTESHTQTRQLTTMDHNVAVSTELMKSTHPDSALQLERLQELQSKIEACCPPPVEPPACHYEPCRSPGGFDVEPPRPDVPGFEPPIRKPSQPG